MLDRKLQLKAGQTIAVIDSPIQLGLAASTAALDAADAVLVFVLKETKLRARLSNLQQSAAAGKLTWVAYPKAGQLGTDLGRDQIRALANNNGLDPVRQIAIDEVWSALRLKGTH